MRRVDMLDSTLIRQYKELWDTQNKSINSPGNLLVPTPQLCPNVNFMLRSCRALLYASETFLKPDGIFEAMKDKRKCERNAVWRHLHPGARCVLGNTQDD
jgi:hypothetical protein